MTLVVDASFVVAALVGRGTEGLWAEKVLFSDNLAAPQFMLVEAASKLRRSALTGELSQDVATLAHRDLLALTIELHPYEPFAQRVWELRGNVTAYDAWYVAIAESLQVPLATVDYRLTRAPGPRCDFLIPPWLNGSRG